MERIPSSDGAPSPLARPVTFGTDLPRAMTLASDTTASTLSGGNPRGRRLTGELPDPARLLAHANGRGEGPRSVLEQESDSENDIEFLPLTSPASGYLPRPHPEYAAPCVQELLPHEFFTEQDLVGHLRQLDESKVATATALDDLWDQRSELDPTNVINSLESYEDEPNPYTNATYEVFEVLKDGTAVRQHDKRDDSDDDILEAATVWGTIKEVNPRRNAVGRMTFLQEPSPLMLGAAHMTMAKHFDMDELFQQLVGTDGNKGKTKAFVNRAFEKDELHRRTFFFVFKYYTVVGEGLKPAPWQQYDNRPSDNRSPDHIDLAECSSILGLSLQGPHMKVVEGRNRRTRRNTRKGYVYDPFAPWHLLSIQCFPDDEHTMRGEEDDSKRFINGPYAFLDALVTEYRDAVKRYTGLNEMITKLITPPSEFMFNRKLRDKLLFEDQDFTYSRRYFWAYNTLGVINEGIKSMISAYLDTFNNDFWAGRHQTLWPHPRADSAEGRSYEFRMSSLRQDLERAVLDLHNMHAKNGRTRAEIRSLREQLFSGSSVKESRRAIEQGDNIKILTGVSMVFLPLTFVTSVFGITEFTISASDWRFPVTMVCVCVPFFIIIFILQTRGGMHAFKKCGNFLGRHLNRYLRAGSTRQHQVQHQGGQYHPSAGKRMLKRTQSGIPNGHAATTDPEKNARSPWPFLGKRRRRAGDLEVGR